MAEVRGKAINETTRKWAKGALLSIEYFEQAYREEREKGRPEVERQLRAATRAATKSESATRSS